MSQSRVTPVGRASFPSLAKTNQYGKYSITILLPKTGPKVAEFVAWLGQVVKEEALTVAGQAGFALAMSEFKSFHDGDDTTAFKTHRQEYLGHWVMSASRKPDFGRPSVVNRQKQPIDASEIYAGCDILAFIDVFGYTFGAKKSVTIGVQHIMKLGENARFAGAGIEADAAFGDLVLPPEDPNAGIPASPFGGAPAPAPVAPPVVPVAPPVVPVAPPMAPVQGVPVQPTNPFGTI